MNGFNTNEPSDHILKVRSIMERVNSRLSPERALSWDMGTPDASRHREAPLEIDPDLCFEAEPDGIMEVAFAAPEFVPSWAMSDASAFSCLDLDDYSEFRFRFEKARSQIQEDLAEFRAKRLASKAMAEAERQPEFHACVKEEKTDTAPPPVTGEPQNGRQASEQANSRAREISVEPERTAKAAASGLKPSFWARLFDEKNALAVHRFMSAAAAVLLVLSVCLLYAAFKPAPTALYIDEDEPLVDLYVIDQPGPVIPDSPAIGPELQAAAGEPEEPALEFITSEELLAEQAAPVPVKGAESERYALDLELALLPEVPPETAVKTARPALLAQVGGSVKKIMASPTLATISEELGIAPSAGDGEEDEAMSPEALYTLEAFPERLPAGRSADVVFTLKKDEQPLSSHGLDIRFESNPAFPNLRDIARYPDENGTFTVKGLMPGKAGVAALRLYVGDISVDAPLYVAAPGIEAPAKPIQTAMAMPAAPSAPASAIESEDIGAPVPPPAEWRINPGLLRGQLELWSVRAGYQLVWEAKNDFEMFSQASFQEDYLGAVRSLFTAMHEQGNPLRVTVYQGNRVLKVTEE